MDRKDDGLTQKNKELPEEHFQCIDDVKRGKYGIAKCVGQTFFYIPKDKFKKIGEEKIKKIIEQVFGDLEARTFDGKIHKMMHSYFIELPSVKQAQGTELVDNGKMEQLIKLLIKEEKEKF